MMDNILIMDMNNRINKHKNVINNARTERSATMDTPNNMILTTDIQSYLLSERIIEILFYLILNSSYDCPKQFIPKNKSLSKRVATLRLIAATAWELYGFTLAYN
jgi:hypothetical protein